MAAGAAGVITLTLLGSLVNESGWLVGIALLVRPIGLLATGTLLLGVNARLQRRVEQLRVRERDELAARAFDKTMAASRRAHAARLREFAGELLEVLATDRALAPAELSRCLTLEGFLRDRVRGDRLARGELVQAVESARLRGIDVQLLDDGTGRQLDDNQLLAVQTWASGLLASTTGGEFVARILPAGRAALATIVRQNGDRRSIVVFPRTADRPVA